MRENYRRLINVVGPVHEIPNPEARHIVDPAVRDCWGVPVARLSETTHPESVRIAVFMAERAKEWLETSGAVRIWSRTPGLFSSAGQHQAGTCRMGTDPRTSVVNPYSCVLGHGNLYIADASAHVTNGGFNPVLTILAIAFRAADHIIQSGKQTGNRSQALVSITGQTCLQTPC